MTDNNITVILSEENISVEATAVGPAGGFLPGAMLVDYSILAQIADVGPGDFTPNLDNGNTFQLTLTGNTTIRPVQGWPGVGEEGKATFYIEQGDPASTLQWPAGVKWMNSASGEVVSVPGGWNVFMLTSVDAGATVFGFHVGFSV